MLKKQVPQNIIWCKIDNIEFYYLYYTLGHFAIFNYNP